MIRAGDLRHRIQIQQNSPTVGSRGEAIDAWATFASRWAAIKSLSGEEVPYARRLDAKLTHELTIRYTAGVTPQMRVLYGSDPTAMRVLSIEAVFDPDGRTEAMKLHCREIVGNTVDIS
jgi:SPP1 family predicted phage head-tail adaptor